MFFSQVAEVAALRAERDEQRRAISGLQARLITAQASNASLQQRLLDLERLLVQSILGHSPDLAAASLALQQSLAPAANPQQLALGAIEGALASLAPRLPSGNIRPVGMDGVHLGTHPAVAVAPTARLTSPLLQSTVSMLAPGSTGAAPSSDDYARVLQLPVAQDAPVPPLPVLHAAAAAPAGSAAVPVAPPTGSGSERAAEADAAVERDVPVSQPRQSSPSAEPSPPPYSQSTAHRPPPPQADATQQQLTQAPALAPAPASAPAPAVLSPIAAPAATSAMPVAVGMQAAPPATEPPLVATAAAPASSLATASEAAKPANMLDLLCSVAHSQDADVGYSTQGDDASSTTSSRDGKEGCAKDGLAAAPATSEASVANDLLSKALAGSLGAAGSLARIRQQSSMAASSMGRPGGGAMGGGGSSSGVWAKRQKLTHS